MMIDVFRFAVIAGHPMTLVWMETRVPKYGGFPHHMAASMSRVDLRTSTERNAVGTAASLSPKTLALNSRDKSEARSGVSTESAHPARLGSSLARQD